MLLAEKWSLGDVEDVEDLVTRTALAELRRRGVTLTRPDFEDLISYLLECAWVESERFDPGRGLRFETYLRQQIKLRFLDHVRKVRGRTSWKWKSHEYHREPRPADLSLDAPGADGTARPLGETILARTSDTAADHAARTDVGLLVDADLNAAGDYDVIQAAFSEHPAERARRDRARAA